jgi:hypothetical protein
MISLLENLSKVTLSHITTNKLETKQRKFGEKFEFKRNEPGRKLERKSIHFNFTVEGCLSAEDELSLFYELCPKRQNRAFHSCKGALAVVSVENVEGNVV